MALDVDEIVERVRAGDMTAFEELVRRFEREIRAWVIVRCPPGGDADDVAQNVFVEAFRNLHRFATGGDMRAWLFSIARYQLLAECTRLSRHADYYSRYAPHALYMELEREVRGARAPQEPRLEQLQHCLQKISAEARELLAWRYAYGLSLAQMAERSGRTVAAIKKHLFVLRERLRECVEAKRLGESR